MLQSSQTIPWKPTSKQACMQQTAFSNVPGIDTALETGSSEEPSVFERAIEVEPPVGMVWVDGDDCGGVVLDWPVAEVATGELVASEPAVVRRWWREWLWGEVVPE